MAKQSSRIVAAKIGLRSVRSRRLGFRRDALFGLVQRLVSVGLALERLVLEEAFGGKSMTLRRVFRRPSSSHRK
jgi:hypothetical protein